MLTLASVGAIAIGAVVAIGVGIVGTAIAAWISAQQSVRVFRLDTALELADSVGQYLDVSDEGWLRMSRALQRLDVRLQVSGIPNDLRSAFRQIEKACWKDCSTATELSGQQTGVDVELLKVEEEVRAAVGMFLGRGKASRRKRSEMRVSAVRKVLDIDPPPTQAEQDSTVFL